MKTLREYVTDTLKGNNPVFAKACELAGIPVTRRQASKWRRGRGLAARNAATASWTLQREERPSA